MTTAPSALRVAEPTPPLSVRLSPRMREQLGRLALITGRSPEAQAAALVAEGLALAVRAFPSVRLALGAP